MTAFDLAAGMQTAGVVRARKYSFLSKFLSKYICSMHRCSCDVKLLRCMDCMLDCACVWWRHRTTALACHGSLRQAACLIMEEIC